MSYYASHVFFCCNQRDGNCCADKGASQMRDYAKKRIGELRLSGPAKVRINQEGPCIVIYPDAVWYTYVDETDIDEIIEEHVRHGRVVERLKL